MNNIIIEEARVEDAQKLLDYMKIIGGETDNVTYGKEGIGLSLEQEENFIRTNRESTTDILLLVKDGDEIVGTGNFTAPKRERLKHRGGIGMTIKKSHWGQGLGSKLLKCLIDFAKNEAKAEIIALEVRTDNERAIRLYEKFGFKIVGRITGLMKIDGKFIDCHMMELIL
ncbi:MAG: GNAT family N-acetyltransferase [Tissierellia bacterium]|nr:GNAT family N-acetyltransferase [Tissierellia bacterium]